LKKYTVKKDISGSSEHFIVELLMGSDLLELYLIRSSTSNKHFWVFILKEVKGCEFNACQVQITTTVLSALTILWLV